MSTEAKVRDQIVVAIQSIATVSLGFDDFKGNVRPYLLEFHPEENPGSYLMANVGGKKLARAWGVQVISSTEQVLATGERYSRLYRATIAGYYSQASGEDVNLLIDHARAVRGAIKALGIRLGGTVDLIESISPLSISTERTAAGKILVGEIEYQFLSQQPEYT